MKTDSKRRLRSARKGKILVLLAICLPALVGMTTLVLDVGVFFACARTVQSMADSTATAAAKEAQLGKTNAEISAACADLVQDDVTLKNTSFTIHRPPTTGA